MKQQIFKLKVKVGDSVRIISGKDKGKTGKIIKVLPRERRVVVESINLHTKYERKRKAGQTSQKITFPSPFSVSKVMLIDATTGEPTRIGYRFLESGVKQRIGRVSGKAV